MRGQSLSQDHFGPSRQSSLRRRPIAVQIGCLIERLEALVSLRSLHWQEPLRVLLTHPRPPAEVQMFHKRMAMRTRSCFESGVFQMTSIVGLKTLAPARPARCCCPSCACPRPDAQAERRGLADPSLVRREAGEAVDWTLYA